MPQTASQWAHTDPQKAKNQKPKTETISFIKDQPELELVHASTLAQIKARWNTKMPTLTYYADLGGVGVVPALLLFLKKRTGSGPSILRFVIIDTRHIFFADQFDHGGQFDVLSYLLAGEVVAATRIWRGLVQNEICPADQPHA